MHGQHENRTERIRETADWLNAAPQTPAGDPLVLDPDLDMDEVMGLLEIVQQGLTTCRTVRVNIANEQNRDYLRRLLSPWELSRVVFEEPGIITDEAGL